MRSDPAHASHQILEGEVVALLQCHQHLAACASMSRLDHMTVMCHLNNLSQRNGISDGLRTDSTLGAPAGAAAALSHCLQGRSSCEAQRIRASVSCSSYTVSAARITCRRRHYCRLHVSTLERVQHLHKQACPCHAKRVPAGRVSALSVHNVYPRACLGMLQIVELALPPYIRLCQAALLSLSSRRAMGSRREFRPIKPADNGCCWPAREERFVGLHVGLQA